MWHVCETGELHARFVLVGRPDRNRLLGRPGHRWDDNINP